MGAPIGNQNAARGRLWGDAIRRAVARRANGDLHHGLDALADKLIVAVANGDLAAIKELGDRLDGKAPQGIVLTGDEDGGPVKVEWPIPKTALDK